MPKSFFVPEDAKSSGIEIKYTKSTRLIYISGWYDSFVGIEGKSISLRDFFNRLGISEKDCRSAFAEVSDNAT